MTENQTIADVADLWEGPAYEYGVTWGPEQKDLHAVTEKLNGFLAEWRKPGSTPAISYALRSQAVCDLPYLLDVANSLEEALDWAMSEIMGNTRYLSDTQRESCIQHALAALAKTGIDRG